MNILVVLTSVTHHIENVSSYIYFEFCWLHISILFLFIYFQPQSISLSLELYRLNVITIQCDYLLHCV